MDDTDAVTPFNDILFTFAYIDTFGPNYGIYVNKTKNQIILATRLMELIHFHTFNHNSQMTYVKSHMTFAKTKFHSKVPSS